jgi:hypothetical protein
MNRNVVGSVYGRPSIKIAHLGSVNKHGQHRQFVLPIGRFPKKSTTPKPLGQMNRNVVGSIYGRPSIKIAHFGSVNKHGQHRQFVLL